MALLLGVASGDVGNASAGANRSDDASVSANRSVEPRTGDTNTTLLQQLAAWGSSASMVNVSWLAAPFWAANSSDVEQQAAAPAVSLRGSISAKGNDHWRRAGTFRVYSDTCLDHHGVYGNAYPHPCHGDSNQLWRVEGDRIISELDGMCLDQRMTDHNAVLWQCHGGRNQRWHIRGEEVVSAENGYCLTYIPAHGGAGAGLRPCNGQPEQRWRWSGGNDGGRPRPPRYSDRLMVGEALFQGQELTARANSIFADSVRLTMQEDGNLVLYKVRGSVWGEHALWSSNTHGSDGDRAEMSWDGQLRVLNRWGSILWESGNSDRAVHARVQEDCNFVMYDGYDKPQWASNTGCFR